MPEQRRTIDFLKGYPNPSLLPAQAISEAAQCALAKPLVATPGLLYGADEGFEPFREAVAQWHSDFYQRSITKDNVVISGGASQNLACLLQVFTDPLYTRNIWISSPAYMLVFRMFQDNGFADKMRAVPEVNDGIDVDWLESELEEASKRMDQDHDSHRTLKPDRPWSKYYRHVIYCVPTFSNPSSSVMPLARREALVRCARKYDALIITDDVYDHLQWSTADAAAFSPLKTALMPRVVDVDAQLDGGFHRPGADGFGNAMSNGSFSKILGPGCRCGWTEGSPKLAHGVSQCGSSRSGGAPSQLTSTFLLELLSSGWLQNNIYTRLQPEYAERYRLMSTAIKKYLVPLGCRMSVPDRFMGGYFIWLALPHGMNGDELAVLCKAKEDLVIISGSQFEVPSKDRIRHNDYIRLCFSWEESIYLEEGIQRLASVLVKLQNAGM